jgi:hypothetical protein
MRKSIGIGIGIAIATSMVVIGGGRAAGSGASGVQSEPGFHCSNATIRGTYGVQMQGRSPVPPQFGGGMQDVIGVVVRTYDGLGSFTQFDNIKGTVTGIVPDRPGGGTYQINADCSGTTVFQPAPGITIEERMVVVEMGDEIRTITSNPPPFMVSAVHKRIDHR